MALRKTALHVEPQRRLAALAIAVALLAALALPAAASEPPSAANPTDGSSAAAPGGLASLVTDWLHHLLGERDPAPSPEDGDVLGNRTGPAGPLIDPNGGAPKDPRPRDGHGSRR